MNKPRTTRSACICAEIGKDGTPRHSGKRFLIRTRVDPVNEGSAACENHMPNYRAAGFLLIRKPGRIKIWKWDGSA